MQIIIVQTEIEEAIRNHVTSQVSVREGMRIDIDLSATRGPEGFKATINIVSENAPRQEDAVHNQTLPPPPPPPAPTARVTRAPRVAKAEPAVAASPEPAKPTTTIVQPEPQAEAPVEEAPAEQVAEPNTEETAAAPAGKSLFGGLARPKND